ncbi:hypothetical protein HMPREF9144_1510, partial [Prevotella pallens ATCC 700821]
EKKEDVSILTHPLLILFNLILFLRTYILTRIKWILLKTFQLNCEMSH